MTQTATPNGANLVAGERSSRGDKIFSVKNPATGAALPGEFVEATAGEIDEALYAASEAAATGLSAQQIADLLNGIADSIESRREAILARCHEETALPQGRLEGECGRTCGQLRLFAGLVEAGWHLDARIDTAQPERQPLPRPDIRSMKVPLGPVAVFGASNFPLAFSVAGGDTASALAAGCPVVVKSHEGHPGTSELVAEAVTAAISESDIPPGYFSLLHGSGAEVGQALVRHPATAAVGFTGSHRAGRAIFDAAAARDVPIPVFAEMGSINMVLLLPGALEGDYDSLAAGLAGSVTLGAGQFCTNPGLVVDTSGSDNRDAFMQALAQQIAEHTPAPMVNASVFRGYNAAREKLAGIDGVKSLAESAPADAWLATRAALYTTSVDVMLKDDRVLEEVFGPATLAASGSLEQVAQLIERLPGQLTASVFGDEADFERCRPVLVALQRRVGRLIRNGFPTGVEVCHAMHHGGPYPATSDGRTTSVGSRAVDRFLRPLCYQDWPDGELPPELQNRNPRGIIRLVDGIFSDATVRPVD